MYLLVFRYTYLHISYITWSYITYLHICIYIYIYINIQGIRTLFTHNYTTASDVFTVSPGNIAWSSLVFRAPRRGNFGAANGRYFRCGSLIFLSMLSQCSKYCWLVVWNMWIIFPHIGNSNPNWLSYFSEGFKPPTRLDAITMFVHPPFFCKTIANKS